MLPSPTEIERRLAVWQRLSQACLHAGKQPGSAWILSIVGHCPLTKASIRVVAQGVDETFLSVMPEVWQKMEDSLADPRLTKLLTT
jgi:hypothetical protein